MKNYIPKIIGFTILIFGLITFYMSGAIILDLFGVRETQGNYVLFVVWSNQLSSIIYLAAAYGFIYDKRWTTLVLAISFTMLITTFAALIIHIKSGGLHEAKTIIAMIFRLVLTLGFTIASFFLISKKKLDNNEI